LIPETTDTFRQGMTLRQSSSGGRTSTHHLLKMRLESSKFYNLFDLEKIFTISLSSMSFQK